MRRAALLTLACLLALPTGAAAQDGTFFFSTISEAGPAPLRQAQGPVELRGAVAAEFRSDPATCASVGHCGLEGTVRWRPSRPGRLFVHEFDPAQRKRPIQVSLLGGIGDDGGGIDARVRRTAGGGSRLCADSTSPEGFFAFMGTARGVDVSPPRAVGPPELFATRCAGPRFADALAALPPRPLTLSQLRRGRLTVDLGGEAPLSSPGLTGVVRSTLAFRVGRVRQDRASASDRRVRGRGNFMRLLSSSFAVERVTGSVEVDVSGSPVQAACAPLDACGATGTMTFTPRATGGDVTLSTLGPTSRGRGALLAALGRRPGGAAPGIEVFGLGTWDDRGTAQASVRAAGAEAPCTDSARLLGGALLLDVGSTTVRAQYLPAPVGRLRCAGTTLPTEQLRAGLASGSVPLRAFGRERVTLRLNRPVAVTTDGYRLRTRPSLEVVLRRGALREDLLRIPGFDYSSPANRW